VASACRTLLETTARVPLLIRDPDYPQSFGKSVGGLVENIDIFPTLVDIAGSPDDKDKLWPPLEGTHSDHMCPDAFLHALSNLMRRAKTLHSVDTGGTTSDIKKVALWFGLCKTSIIEGSGLPVL
jgi:arylsulfatase A-like enzyme